MIRCFGPALEEHFWSRVLKTKTCWNWTGALNNRGYGVIRVGGRKGRLFLAHRVAFQFQSGHAPNKWVLHKCDNKRCLRYSHLYEGTRKQNTRDAVERHRGARKLTPSIVRKMRTTHLSGTSILRVSKLFGVAYNTAWKVIRLKNWALVGTK